MRERVMGRLRKRKVEFLVATDVAARGLDVDEIEIVFNYDLPHDGEDYVHRIGRTGRAGKGGKAVTFVAGREIYRLEVSRLSPSWRLMPASMTTAVHRSKRSARLSISSSRVKSKGVLTCQSLDRGRTLSEKLSQMAADESRFAQEEKADLRFLLNRW